MLVTPTAIPDVLILEPQVFGDDRGLFFESYNRRAFREATGRNVDFVQDNHSRSARHVLRGMHYQIRQPQGKLVRVTAGEVFDAVVDLRKSSPTFGKWTGVMLSAANRRMLAAVPSAHSKAPPVALPGPNPVGCSNLEQDFARVPQGETAESYWRGLATEEGERYVTDLLADPAIALVRTFVAPAVGSL